MNACKSRLICSFNKQTLLPRCLRRQRSCRGSCRRGDNFISRPIYARQYLQPRLRYSHAHFIWNQTASMLTLQHASVSNILSLDTKLKKVTTQDTNWRRVMNHFCPSWLMHIFICFTLLARLLLRKTLRERLKRLDTFMYVPDGSKQDK